MRQLVSTALVACIVGALAGATVSTVAQAPAEPPTDEAIVTAGLNADRVDGLNAVKATSKKIKRKNRLVATDTKGFLPANIVKPLWRLMQGTPPGFADGIDDAGVTHLTITRVVASKIILNGATDIVEAPCPAGSVPAGGGFQVYYGVHALGAYDEGQVWRVMAQNLSGADQTIFSVAKCLSAQPAGAISLARRGVKAAKALRQKTR